MSGPAIVPLELTLDASDVREAGRIWSGRDPRGLILRPAQLIVGIVYAILGIAGFVFGRPASIASMLGVTSSVFVVLGAVAALQGIGQLDFQPRPLRVGALRIDDDGLLATDERGKRTAIPWTAIKSVERTADVLVFVLTWRRAITIPAAAIADLPQLWANLYALLVSRRGLRPTPIDRLNEIVNTALR